MPGAVRNADRMNQNQRYEVLMHFPGYEGSPCGIHRDEYATNGFVSKIRSDWEALLTGLGGEKCHFFKVGTYGIRR